MVLYYIHSREIFTNCSTPIIVYKAKVLMLFPFTISEKAIFVVDELEMTPKRPTVDKRNSIYSLKEWTTKHTKHKPKKSHFQEFVRQTIEGHFQFIIRIYI